MQISDQEVPQRRNHRGRMDRSTFYQPRQPSGDAARDTRHRSRSRSLVRLAPSESSTAPHPGS
jgi:hypothetical protein